MKSLYIICCISMLLATACKKDSYLTDGGVHNANTGLSTYEYLAQHSAHYFDTTILLIDHFGLRDSVNKAGTFFAFTDYSINLLMNKEGYASLEDLYNNTTAKIITQYLFTDSISLYNTSTNVQPEENWAGEIAPCGVKKLLGTYTVYLTNSSATYSYYYLQYVKINGVLDGSTNAPENDPTDLAISCQTTGIKTSTGTTLHVLVNNASINNIQ
ncbi:hypothetical protein [Chitinophaga sp. LS1]|uniref:hypothetical protein n=1 Tax=Chitinophaga sp. LS1 TaxID=3051176 RepID=UPI002AAB9DAF|nr:hypothetical protein [Chitinophaga sp. LS1]WPV69722.1 hypothetical protein QQL36_13545 [Chitinophaga sp. LS1]